MTKSLIYPLAILGIAAIFGAAGTFFGYYLAKLDEPAVVVYNLTKASIPEIRVESDVGETFVVGSLAPDSNRRLKISGRDKAAWIVITTEAGQRRESQRLYVTSRGILFAVITDSAITVDYQL
jgi:hypothetical protein